TRRSDRSVRSDRSDRGKEPSLPANFLLDSVLRHGRRENRGWRAPDRSSPLSDRPDVSHLPDRRDTLVRQVRLVRWVRQGQRTFTACQPLLDSAARHGQHKVEDGMRQLVPRPYRTGRTHRTYRTLAIPKCYRLWSGGSSMNEKM